MQDEVSQTGGAVIPFRPPAPADDLEPEAPALEDVLDDWADYLKREVIPRLSPESEWWWRARGDRRDIARGEPGNRSHVTGRPDALKATLEKFERQAHRAEGVED